jgi:hypothetical protein
MQATSSCICAWTPYKLQWPCAANKHATNSPSTFSSDRSRVTAIQYSNARKLSPACKLWAAQT